MARYTFRIRQGSHSSTPRVVGVSMIQPYDDPTIAVLRRALNDVFADRRFIRQRSTSALEIAEHLLAQAAAGERDLDRLKDSALAR